MVVITESSEAGKRDVLRLVAQTDKPDHPSVSEIFEAQSHFITRPTEGCTYFPITSSYQPNRRTLDGLATLPTFSSGGAKFWVLKSAE